MEKLKLLWRLEHGASFYIMKGLANAFRKLGHELYFWDSSQISAFRAFDDIEPDIIFLQNYNLDNAQIKCCNNRPNLKVVMKSGFFGDFVREYKGKFETGPFCEEDHFQKTMQIQNIKLIFGYGWKPQYILGDWEKYHKIWGFLPAADLDTYFPVQPKEEYKSDCFFTGGYWNYKSQQLNWLIKLCHPIGKYNIKICGNGIWPTTNYIGQISDEEQRIYQSSALICPNLSEPHAVNIEKGFEVNERIFKLASSRCFVISDHIASLTEDIFKNNELITCKTFDEFKDHIDYFIKNPDKRLPYIEKLTNEVLKNHTYLNRANELLTLLGYNTKNAKKNQV